MQNLLIAIIPIIPVVVGSLSTLLSQKPQIEAQKERERIALKREKLEEIGELLYKEERFINFVPEREVISSTFEEIKGIPRDIDRLRFLVLIYCPNINSLVESIANLSRQIEEKIYELPYGILPSEKPPIIIYKLEVSEIQASARAKFQEASRQISIELRRINEPPSIIKRIRLSIASSVQTVFHKRIRH